MKIFSPLLKRQIKDCLLAIFWPKKDVYNFFKQHACPANVLAAIGDWDAQGLSRAKIIDVAFESLENLPDNGTLYFNLFLDSLSEWSHFDDFWFKTENKLDLGEAKKKIAALKSAKEKDIDKARERVNKKIERDKGLQEKHSSLKEMREDFQIICLGSHTAQQRGYAFEKFLTKMARFFDLKTSESFRLKGTQIDGTIKFDGENYSLEAKWHDRSLSDEPLLAFCHKQEINMHGRGIFISVNGYTAGALSMLERSSIKNTILMDGEDITLILQEMITLPAALDKKIHAAQTRGMFYINPITGESKIKN